MPINFQQALQTIREMGSQARLRSQARKALREQALVMLRGWAGREQELRGLVERAARLNAHLRSAVPASGRLDAHLLPMGPIPARTVLLAADGSQINPDRHAAVEFGAINVGAIRLFSPEPPAETVNSQLLFYDDLYVDNTPLTEAIVALRRDKEERALLLRLAEKEPRDERLLLTLTDGPLELYTQDQNSALYKRALAEYIEVLHGLAGLGAGAAGYVDKPGSDYLARLLELVVLDGQNQLGQAGRERPFFPLRDAEILDALLEPGERSAVFGLRSPAAENFKDQLSIHFFYLNAGRPGKPHLARVEIPQWVAADLNLLDALHAVLLVQIRQMGAVGPYPYVLHRAHEIAVVSFAEKEELENLIAAELRKQGVEVGEKSSKQFHKDGSTL